MRLLVKGARIVDFSSDFYGDIYINDGIIEQIGKNINFDCETLNAEGYVVLPSFIDLHAHFRDPGFPDSEDITTGSMAAAKGGYTAVNLMANTKPVCSDNKILEYVYEKARSLGLIDINQTLSITRDFDGSDISHIDGINRQVKFISDDGRGVTNNETMLAAMEMAREKGICVISHAEYEKISSIDTRLSENLMTVRDIMLAKFAGCHLHMAHVSTKEAIKEIIRAKMDKVNVTCEVTPHHIALVKSDYKVNPPVRDEEDIKCLTDAIDNGWIDAIATDHAPHTIENKKNGSPGISGIETAFSVCYTKLVKENNISLKRLSELMSKRPGEIMGLKKGQIKTGFDGDFTIVDLNKRFRINSENFVSKGKNTPFDGMEFYGEIICTIKGGKVVYEKK